MVLEDTVETHVDELMWYGDKKKMMTLVTHSNICFFLVYTRDSSRLKGPMCYGGRVHSVKDHRLLCNPPSRPFVKGMLGHVAFDSY